MAGRAALVWLLCSGHCILHNHKDHQNVMQRHRHLDRVGDQVQVPLPRFCADNTPFRKRPCRRCLSGSEVV